MPRMKLYVERCKACKYCLLACRKDAISVSDLINSKGFQVIKVDEQKCNYCGSCYTFCPDYVFEIR